MKDEQKAHNEELENLTDQQIDKIVEKAGQMLNSETQSEPTNMLDAFHKRSAKKTGENKVNKNERIAHFVAHSNFGNLTC